MGVGGRAGLGTLLGPEETGRFRGHCLRVVALSASDHKELAGLPLLLT